MENQADVGLIAACQQGDPRSFQRLFEIYRDRVYALCRHMAGNDEDAEDLTQESFVQAHSTRQKVKDLHSLVDEFMFRVSKPHKSIAERSTGLCHPKLRIYMRSCNGICPGTKPG